MEKNYVSLTVAYVAYGNKVIEIIKQSLLQLKLQDGPWIRDHTAILKQIQEQGVNNIAPVFLQFAKSDKVSSLDHNNGKSLHIINGHPKVNAKSSQSVLYQQCGNFSKWYLCTALSHCAPSN